MKIRLLLIMIPALALTMGASCIRRPKGVKSDSDMLPVVTDMTLADSYLRTVGGNSPEQRKAMVEYVLEKHGMTQEEYDSTMVWYARNSDEYYDFTEKVGKELDKRKRKLKGTSAVQEDSNDLWPYPRMAVVSPLGVYDGFNFSVPIPDVEKGQRIRFKMRMNSPMEGDLLFGVEYENGTKSYQTSALRGNRFELSLQTDTAGKVKRIFGNLTLDREAKRTVWIDSISLAALPFDSTMYYQIHSQRRYSEPRRRRPAAAADSAKVDSVKEKPAMVGNIEKSDLKPAKPVKPDLNFQKRI